MIEKSNQDRIWVPSLYFTEGLPYIIVIAVSVIMYKKLGLTNTEIGVYTSWLYLPWVIKPLWSPLVDLFGSKKQWFLTMQMIMAGAFIGVGLCLPTSQMIWMSLLFLWILAFASATHDIAADGFYMLGLNLEKQAFYLGLRSTFYRLAMIAGQGLLVVLAGYLEVRFSDNIRAWQITFLVAGILMLFLSFVNYYFTPTIVQEKIDDDQLNFFSLFADFFKKDNVLPALLFILFFRLGESQLLKMSSPFLLDDRVSGGLLLSTTEVGVIYGTIGVIFLSLGGILGGILISRDGLGRWMLPMVLALNVPNALYALLAYLQPESIYAVTPVVIVEQFGYGFGFAAFLMFLIYVARGVHKTSHYAIGTGFMALGMMLPGMLSGYLQEYLGYTGFFIWVTVASIPGLILLKYIDYPADYGKKGYEE